MDSPGGPNTISKVLKQKRKMWDEGESGKQMASLEGLNLLLLAIKMKKGTTGQECKKSLEAKKRWGNRISPKSLYKKHLLTLWF